MSISSKIHVAVLRGGPSSEYDVSLKTGGHVLKSLSEKYQGHDVLIDQNGVWHMDGLPKSPDKILNRVDVVFNALHGAFGENGQLQYILQTHAVPFTGSLSFASMIGMNKILSKEIYKANNIKTPQHMVFRNGDDLREKVNLIFKSFSMPIIIKPASSGSSFGVSIASTIPELYQAIATAMIYSHGVLIEEFIKGREATCGVIENFRGEPLYALLPTEIRQRKKSDMHVLFDYTQKYSDSGVDEITPGNFSTEEKKIIERLAQEAHCALGLRHYSRSDFIVTPKRGIYILETNTLPGLTEQSLMPKAFSAGGISMSHFLDHVLTLAMK